VFNIDEIDHRLMKTENKKNFRQGEKDPSFYKFFSGKNCFFESFVPLIHHIPKSLTLPNKKSDQGMGEEKTFILEGQMK